MRNAAMKASAGSDCEAEVVREHALSNQSRETAAEDADGGQRSRSTSPTRRRCHWPFIIRRASLSDRILQGRHV
jgi:hypothetical protein